MFQLYLRGDWPSVCPALLRYPRRNLVAPGIQDFQPDNHYLIYGRCPGLQAAWGFASQVLQQLQRLIDHPVGSPGFGIVAVQVTEFGDYHGHARSPPGLHIAPVVAEVDAILRVDADAPARGEQPRVEPPPEDPA